MNILSKKLFIVQKIGSKFLNLCCSTGRVTIFSKKIIKNILTPPYYPKEILDNFINIGFYSLPVVALTAIFTGAVLALQTHTGFSRFNAESTVAIVVVLSITRELGPVLAGLMVAGRIGSSIAAEISTMRVTEQIDALETLSINPYSYLIAPKVIACMVSLPLLVLVADIIGVLGGYLTANIILDFSSVAYLKNTVDFVELKDILSGVYKATCFGFIIALMGCYHGYYSNLGARGVGRATTIAVVSSSILILLSNYALTQFLFTK